MKFLDKYQLIIDGLPKPSQSKKIDMYRASEKKDMLLSQNSNLRASSKSHHFSDRLLITYLIVYKPIIRNCFYRFEFITIVHASVFQLMKYT